MTPLQKRLDEIQALLDFMAKQELSNGTSDHTQFLLTVVRKQQEALERIAGGGVRNGVLADTEERMLAMCEISELALEEIEKLAGKKC